MNSKFKKHLEIIYGRELTSYELELEQEFKKKLSPKDWNDLNKETARFNKECTGWTIIKPANKN